MDRKGLKAAAKQCIQDSESRVTLITILFLAGYLLLLGLSVLLEFLPDLLDTSGARYLSQSLSLTNRNLILTTGLGMVLSFVAVMFRVGYAALGLDLSRRKTSEAGVLLDGFRIWSRVLLADVVVILITSCVAGVLSIPLSFVLAVISLQVPLTETSLAVIVMCFAVFVTLIVGYRYRLRYFVLLDRPHLTVRQLLLRTTAINRGHRRELFLMDLSFLPWVLLSALTCGILLIWKLPYIISTYAHAYNDLLGQFDRRVAEMEEQLKRRYPGSQT